MFGAVLLTFRQTSEKVQKNSRTNDNLGIVTISRWGQDMETNNTHGGKRENSGRKGFGGPTTVIRVRADLLPAIERLKAGLSPDTTEAVTPRLLELQRKYDLEHQKSLDLSAKLHAMQSKIDAADKLRAEVAEAEKLAHTRLGEINKLRDKVARLERELKLLQNQK